MKNIFILILVIISSKTNFAQNIINCADSVQFPLWDLTICRDSNMSIGGDYEQGFTILQSSNIKDSAVLPVKIKLDFNELQEDGKQIWNKNVIPIYPNVEQVMVLQDTNITMNGNEVYWNEASFKGKDGSFMFVFYSVVFVENHYYTFQIKSPTYFPRTRVKLMELITRCKFKENDQFEENYLLQRDFAENLVLSVQNEMRLESLLLKFEDFYSSIPETEKTPESEVEMKKLIGTQNENARNLIRSLKKYESIRIKKIVFKADKTSDKLAAFKGLIALQCDREAVNLKIYAMKINGELFLMLIGIQA
ncbi:MAG: hypothetical protein KDC84_12545 [Crocinitomicaceae bacterium]|nr:hypothetical protein [Crocinitomicaceae bacterium]